MPRRGSSDVRCTVAGCRCEWIEVSKNRHLYCHEHMLQANALYAEYKAANATALATFADDALDQCIRLREEYARKFLDYEDTGAHRAYICILKRVRSVGSSVGSSVAAFTAYQCYAYQCYACQCYAYQCYAYQCYACRRAAYNRWMMESAHFPDFSAQGQAAVLHK